MDSDYSHESERNLLPGRNAMTNPYKVLKSKASTLPTKVWLVKAMVFSAVMYGYESWTIKNAEQGRIDAFELRCWRRPWESLGQWGDQTKPVNPKGNQSWKFTGRTNAEAPILWPPDAKTWFTGKDSDAGRNWGQEEKGVTEDEMVGWHHWLNGHESKQTLGDSKGQGRLACCSPWGRKESDTT